MARKEAKTKAAKPRKGAADAPRRRRGEHGPSYTDEQIINALRAAQGFISMAADVLGCAQNTIRDRIKTSKAVADALRDINEAALDYSESKLLLAIKAGKFEAIKFHLERKGASRGYAPQQQVEVRTPGAAILEQVTVADIDRILAMREGGAG